MLYDPQQVKKSLVFQTRPLGNVITSTDSSLNLRVSGEGLVEVYTG